jgi:type II secretory ATPase GspE/PulE/Tfp pilus assembly ATPase PilB-like protein
VSDNEGVDFEQIEQLEGETELTPPELYASNLIDWAVDRHASDLYLSDSANSVVVSVRRLGRIEVVRRLARDYGHRLQGHLRVLAGSDAVENMRPTEGRGVVETPSGGPVDLRLSTIPTLTGQDVAIRLFDPKRGSRAIDNLGMDQVELELMKQLLKRPSGLILFVGPVASGKSTSMYALIDRLNDGTRKIHTLEDPIERAIPNVMQTQINLRAGLDYSDLLAVVLRHGPDVIMIGEIRDLRTAAAAVRAGASGQLVLATMHAKSASEAVDTMLHYDVHPKFLAGALIGVINQRLLRRLCPECRKPIEQQQELNVSDRIANRLGDEQARLYKSVGCPKCFGDGFDSLTCVPEIMSIDKKLSDAIANGSTSAELQDLAEQQGMLSMVESIVTRVYNGTTTPQEANRVVSDPDLAALAALG